MDESDTLPLHREQPRGIITPKAGPAPFVVTRWDVPDALKPYVRLLWRVRWQLPPGEVHVQHTLPYPVVHVVFENGDADVVGPIPDRFERRIEGDGGVLGVHFRPAVFRALSPVPLRRLRHRRIPVGEFFGAEALAVARALPSLDSTASQHAVCAWLETLLPPAVPVPLRILRDRVEAMATQPGPGVAEIAALHRVSERTLQRQFDDAVGWTPRQVLRRRRIHDAMARLDASPNVDLATVALEVGYCDQAHFSRDFRALTGHTPRAYVADPAS